jgi:pectate lyase
MKLELANMLLVTALLGATPAAAAVPGFAGNMTGGANATPVVVSTLSAAQAAVNNYSGSGGLVLHYNGTFDEAPILADICGQWSKPVQELSISGKNDITILGMDGSSANFGIRIKGTSNNIIVRNMKIGLLPGGASNGDLIGIEANSHHVWIDHNELYTRNINCPGTPDDDTTFDGLLDIKNSATFITVSYNFIHDHAKVGLVGASDTDSAERRITYAHNRYDNVGSRLPFQRFGFVHVYNNYYNNITGSGINPRMGGHVLIENNFFENALNPVFSQSPILGQWDLRNNNARGSADNARFNIRWTACSGSTPCQKATNWTTTATFPITLPYGYTTYAPEVSRCIALNAAGSGKGLREAVDVLNMCGSQPPMNSVYQTENGAVGGGTVLESTNAGFNGAGYVNSSASGGFAQINNIDGRGGGSKTLRIRFALGVSAARTGRLVVNGVGTNITFNPTGAWTAWVLQDVVVTLNNNTTNTIRFESTGQDLANIDQVEIL